MSSGARTLEARPLGVQHVSHQFEDIEQQNECYIVGMWTFLVTEVMFFGALFLLLTVYRGLYPVEFHEAHNELSIPLGFLNTGVLLVSSLSMALAVRAHMLGSKRGVLALLGVTLICAFGFLGVKSIEYREKFEKHHFPGPNFKWEQLKTDNTYKGVGSVNTGEATQDQSGVQPQPTSDEYKVQPLRSDKQQLFFSIYFAMTGLHALHIIIGILIIGAIWIMLQLGHPAVQDYMPIEMTGLYWHFVDIVWIFLFPLIYLIGK